MGTAVIPWAPDCISLHRGLRQSLLNVINQEPHAFKSSSVPDLGLKDFPSLRLFS